MLKTFPLFFLKKSFDKGYDDDDDGSSQEIYPKLDVCNILYKEGGRAIISGIIPSLGRRVDFSSRSVRRGRKKTFMPVRYNI